jgi:hypothetical protein
MNITGKITGIKYKVLLAEYLNEFDIKDFNINNSPLVDVSVDGVKMKSKAVLKLTSEKLKGSINEKVEIWDRPMFLLENPFSQEQIRFVDALLDEAGENGFEVRIENNEYV